MSKLVFSEGIHSISNDDYHSSDGVSRSVLWTFKELPQKYFHQYLSGNYERPKQTESYLIGNMVHTLLLEPHLFYEQYFVMPKVNRVTKQGKLDYADALVEAGTKELVNEAQLECVMDMVDSLNSQQVVESVVSTAICEQSIFWRDEETGLMCKARPDIWSHPLCADLKTTEDAGMRSFQISAMKYGYFMQAAMIYEALKSIGSPFDKFLFICVEKKKPYSVGMYMLDDAALKFGIDLFHSTLRKFAECQRTNIWPDYGVQMLTLPKYATLELDNE